MTIAPRLTAIAAALALALGPAAWATSTAPLRLEMTYDGVLNALHLTGEAKVLVLRVVERAGPDDFSTTAEMKSYGLLRVFKLIDIHTSAQGPVAAGEPQPRDFAFTAVDRRRVRHAALTWSDSDVTVSPPSHVTGDPAPTPAQKLGAADPLTQFSRAAYAASGQDLCARQWRFFDGDEIYELRPLGGETASLSDRDRSLGLTEAVRCSVRYAEVAGFKHRHGERRDEGLSSAIHAQFGRLGEAGPWVLMSMKADTILGYAKVALSGVKVGEP